MRHAAYRELWIAWIGACMAMWMSDVAAAWTMTSLTASPVLVALVQTAATLPVFLLGVPLGALADIADRRRLLIATQVWAALVASALFAAVATAAVVPVLLLALVFANGLVFALRWPAFSAIVPDLVPAREITVAMALNGVANNFSRVAGPLLAGAIIAAAGSAWVFALNALLCTVAAILIARWAHPPRAARLPAETFVHAMRGGLRYVRRSTSMRRVLLHVVVAFFNTIALMALLPLVARRFPDTGPGTYTLLMAGMGAGAVTGAFAVSAIDRRAGARARHSLGMLLFAAATLGAAIAPHAWIALPATFLAGIAFMLFANTLVVAGTLALPSALRARGLSIYQMALMGASAAGAAWWGWVATATSIRTALGLAAAAIVVGVAATRRVDLPLQAIEDAPQHEASAAVVRRGARVHVAERRR